MLDFIYNDAMNILFIKNLFGRIYWDIISLKYMTTYWRRIIEVTEDI